MLRLFEQQLNNSQTPALNIFAHSVLHPASVHFWLFLIKFAFLWYSHGMQKENGKSYNKHLCWFLFLFVARTFFLSLAQRTRASCTCFSSIIPFQHFEYSHSHFNFVFSIFQFFLVFLQLIFLFSHFSMHYFHWRFVFLDMLRRHNLVVHVFWPKCLLIFSFFSMTFACLHGALLCRFSHFTILDVVKSSEKMNENFHLEWKPMRRKTTKQYVFTYGKETNWFQ